MEHRQITIIGGGPVGLVCALLLAKQGISVTILEAKMHKQDDGRVLALSYASVAVLNELGAWPSDLATSINQVHISHSGLGISNILASDVNLPQLGYTIKYTDVCSQLKHAVDKYSNINWCMCNVEEVISGDGFATIMYQHEAQTKYLTTDLAILAEGGKIKIKDAAYKEYDYRQTAITTEIITHKKHINIAYERFDNSGAYVLLPHGDNFILVWSLPSAKAQELLEHDLLIEHLQQMSFMKRFGKIKVNGKVFSFPLKLRIAKKKAFDRVILIGNSAQTVHPVSAQGMNLAIRDAVTLTELITNNDIGPELISTYNELRTADTKFVIGFTHSLAKYLDKRIPGFSHIRGAGIMALSNCKPAQNIIANSLIFGV